MKTVKQIQNEIFTMYYQTPFKGLSKRQFVELGLQNALKFFRNKRSARSKHNHPRTQQPQSILWAM